MREEDEKGKRIERCKENTRKKTQNDLQNKNQKLNLGTIFFLNQGFIGCTA